MNVTLKLRTSFLNIDLSDVEVGEITRIKKQTQLEDTIKVSRNKHTEACSDDGVLMEIMFQRIRRLTGGECGVEMVVATIAGE